MLLSSGVDKRGLGGRLTASRSGQGRAARSVECIALIPHAPVWYIVAWDLDKDASRTFRMDRIAGAQCGEALKGQHALAEVMPEQQVADDAWGRRPLG